MKSIEKSLTNYIQGKNGKIDNDKICSMAEKKDANKIINTLFKVINNELESVTGVESLNRLREVINMITVITENSADVNRKQVARKLRKLDEKIDRIRDEKKKHFINSTKAIEELEKTRQEIELIDERNSKNENKQYEFIYYLIDVIKNISYLEYTFNKMPSLVNVKDKEENSLFKNIIIKYIESAKKDNDEDMLYYSNLISLTLSQKKFSMNEKEKRKCLEIIYQAIDSLSVTKKKQKINKEKIEHFNELINNIKGNNDKKVDIETLASKYNIHIFFDADIIEKAKLVRINNSEDRYFVDDYIITIDKKDAVEIDDALSCTRLSNGNYLIGIHIASILGYFPYNSDIVEEAIYRNRSVYLPRNYQTNDNDFKRTIPIFPYDFSAVNGSLIPNEARLARSYFFEIDRDGDIVDKNFKKTIIKSNRKTTYKEIDKVLNHGSEDARLQVLVNNLQAETDILDKRYKISKIYEELKEDTDDFSDIKVKRVGAEKIVYQNMLLTGNGVAEFFADKGYPCLYRVHEVNESNTKKIENMLENLNKNYGNDQYKRLTELLRGLYPNGWYALEGGHSGLGLDHYCHCTSGLRRAADIVVEHALEVCYDNIPTDKELEILKEEIEKRATEINSKHSPTEWFIKEYKKIYYRR